MALDIYPGDLFPDGHGAIAVSSARRARVEVSDAVTMSDTITGNFVKQLADHFLMSEVLSSTATLAGALSDGFTLSDMIAVGFSVLLSDGFTLSDTVTPTRHTLPTLRDILIMSDALASNATIQGALADAMVLADLISRSFDKSLADGVTLSETISSSLTAANELLDGLTMSDTLTPSFRMYGILSDGMTLSDTLSSNVTVQGLLSDGIKFGGILTIEDEEYVAWVLNTENLAISKYEYPVVLNSFAELKGRNFALSDVALYELTGDSDDGADIDAVIKTGMSQLGTTFLKHVPRAYLYYSSSTSGSLIIKTITTDGGSKIERLYPLKAQPGPEMYPVRRKLAGGLESLYWQFQAENRDGAPFELDAFKVAPMILKRRVRRS